jgi:hypothetical protein
VWRSFVCLLVWYVFELFIYKTQTNSCYKFYASQNAYSSYVLFHVLTEGNCDVFGGVTGLPVL